MARKPSSDGMTRDSDRNPVAELTELAGARSNSKTLSPYRLNRDRAERAFRETQTDGADSILQEGAGRLGGRSPRMRRVCRRPLQMARNSTCFLRPSESLTTPEARRASRPMTARSSSSATSLTRRAPPRIWRRASPVEPTRPARRKAVSAPRPASNSAAATSTVGSDSASSPSSKVLSRGRRRRLRRLASVQQRGRLVGENLLRLVDLGPAERLEPSDLVERQ